MEHSPAKRRKTSPTTSLPINAPTTPSRIPVLRRDGDKTPTSRPSFASPTKASFSRHNPQLLSRPTSSGAGSGKPGGKEEIDGLFAKFLGGNPAGSEDLGVTEEPERASSQGATGQGVGTALGTSRPVTPRGKKSVVTGKPRRRSQSPMKSPVKVQNFTGTSNVPDIYRGDLPDNPFQKKGGLRRSPTTSQGDAIPNSNPSQDIPSDINPFQKRTGLRRSPISSQPVSSQQPEVEKEVQQQPETPPMPKPALRRSPVILQPPAQPDSAIAQLGGFPGISPVRRGALRRSPVIAVTQPLEPVPSDDAPLENEPELERPNTTARVLRRSPILRSSPPVEVNAPIEPENPLPIRGRLRRSPVGNSSQDPVNAKEPSASPAETETQNSLKSRLRNSPVHSIQPAETQAAIEEKQPEVPTFRKSALRRSPIVGAPVEESGLSPDQVLATTRRGALRRSPVQASNPETLQAPPSQTESTTPTAPVPAIARISLGAIELEETIVPELDESPLISLPEKNVFSGSQRHEEPIAPLEFPKNVDIEQQPSDMIELGRPSKPGFHGEPELPPTPTQKGLDDPVVTTPPKGIHNTPSKRGRRNGALVEKLRSSPLKPRSQVTESSQEIIPDSQPEIISAPKPKIDQSTKRRKSARFTIPEDPHAEKRKARDALLKQLQELQADVALANQENERLRAHQEAGKRRAPIAPNSEELLAFLERSTQKPVQDKPKPVSIFKSINSFLPFSSRRKTQAIRISEIEKPLPSHLPTHLDDPLPYLQAFSPLMFTSTVTLEEEASAQKYVIHASHPSGSFAARIDMLVDSESLSVKQLEVPRLDPAAEQELGAFVRSKTKDGRSKEPGVICWSMGRWTEVAVQRAKFWCEVESQLGTPEARAKSLKALRTGRKRKRMAMAEEDEDEGSSNEKPAWTRKQLLLHMGRTSMEIVNEEVEILLEWKIGFDLTGEAESSISANARVPKSWQQQDERNTLPQIPDMFQKLVKEKGPWGAVTGVVGLLMRDTDGDS
ncbi:hypothetical protein HYALB_00009038 [Hymenoscyphus albidus]|uniref:Uncharacterized protein n=1 Tax=Hymenoscyphus albidus TaxID=595503 RepID=A0A9N9PTG0_9HELO|nr:hypothetical protein HYALB_00009038 [Hymenoscyphus albidus]